MKQFLRGRSWLAGVGVFSLIVVACGGGSGSGVASSSASEAFQELGLIETLNPGNLSIGPQVGKLAPNFRLAKATGGTLALSDLRGKPVLLNFWATWCGPCLIEMPELQSVHERLGDKLTVLAANLGESSTRAQDYFDELGLTFTTVLDRDEEVYGGYRGFGLPTSVFIDAEGIVRAVKIGPFVNAEDINKSLARLGL